MPLQYRSTTLYDGPIVVDLPTNFDDISEQRGASDTEFVFGCKTGFTTIIFDITQRVVSPSEHLKSKISGRRLLNLEDAASNIGRELFATDIDPLIDADIDAITYHLEDIMEIREEVVKKTAAEREATLNEIDDAEVWEAPRAISFEHVSRPCYTTTLKLTPNPKSTRRRRPEDPEFVVVFLTLIRMEEEETDVVVAVNVPLRKGEFVVGREREAGLVVEGRGIVERIWKTLELRGSFGAY